jgi:predicted MPP superfamily phosphohydrolase
MCIRIADRTEQVRDSLPLISINRRKFIGLAAAAGVGAVAADAFLLAPNHPRIVRREIALRRWPEQLNGFKIVQLSDLHYDPYFSEHPLKSAIDIVNNLHPDLIVVTGDFVTAPWFNGDDAKAAANAGPCAELLRKMNAPHGLLAVLGNHDWSTDPRQVMGELQSAGIPVLSNSSVPIEANGARLWISGIADILSEACDLDMTCGKVPRDEATILLAHEPDYADHVVRRAIDHPVDLQLSGHSHGGQVRLPFVPPFYLPIMGRRYYSGQYQVGPLTVYTNVGLGTMGVPVRLNCPPEITLLTLRSAAV